MLEDIDKRTGRLREDSAAPETTPPASGVDIVPGQGPAFIRLPRPGDRCRHTGLSRTAMNELVLGDGAPVGSVVLKKPGTARGIRLVKLESLLGHLEAEMARQRGAAVAAGEVAAAQVPEGDGAEEGLETQQH